MYVRVWQYDVADASREEFERVYRRCCGLALSEVELAP
jgi:hypothetical protein